MRYRVLTVGPVATNCYILYGDDAFAVAVDPGAEGGAIAAYVKSLGLEIKQIWLTHGHFDHICGAAELKKAFGAEIYMHESDIVMIDDPYKNFSAAFGMDACGGFEPDVILKGGESIDAPFCTARVIHTPGHSEGGVCYDTGEFLFAGDTLMDGSFGRFDGFGGSYPKLRDSLLKLFETEGERTVLPGHGAASLLSRERISNAIIRGGGRV